MPVEKSRRALRRAEPCARWEDVDLNGALLRVPRPKGFTSGHKPRASLNWRFPCIYHSGILSGLVITIPEYYPEFS